MLSLFAAIFFVSTTPVQQLTNACVDEGTKRSECVCYAKFIKKNTTARELKALSTLAEPQNRGSLKTAFQALQAAGLTPNEILKIGMRVEKLTDDATKSCKGK